MLLRLFASAESFVSSRQAARRREGVVRWTGRGEQRGALPAAVGFPMHIFWRRWLTLHVRFIETFSAAQHSHTYFWLATFCSCAFFFFATRVERRGRALPNGVSYRSLLVWAGLAVTAALDILCVFLLEQQQT